MRPVFRVQPVGPAVAYQTFRIAAPLHSHTRSGTCQEVECEAFRNGWRSVIDTGTALGTEQARYIANRSDRRYSMEQNGTVVTFTFPAGQQCFADHRVPLERPAAFLIRNGDWRGNPTGVPPVRVGSVEWVERFSERLDAIEQRQKRG